MYNPDDAVAKVDGYETMEITKVAQEVQRSAFPDAYADPRFNPEPDQQSGYQTKSLLTYPMTGQEGRVIGVFQAVNKNGGGAFTDAQSRARLLASALKLVPWL